MPTTPDRPDGRPAGSEDQFEAAEAAHLAAREAARVDRARRPEALGTAGVKRPIAVRRAVPDGPARRETVVVGPEEPGRRETVTQPVRRRPAGRARGAPLLVAAGFATLWAALLSYVPVAAVIGLARTLEGAGGLGGAAQAGLAGWLLGHGVPIGTSIGPLGLAPLLLTLLAAWRLNRAGLHVVRAIGARRSGSRRAALLVAGTVGVWYALLGALAAVAVDGPGSAVSTSRAAVNFFVLGALGALVGALSSTDALVVLAHRIPRAMRHGLRTGVVAALQILAAGAAFTGLSVALGGGHAADMIAAYRTGVAGQAGITLLSLAYGANAAVWAAAYLLGPGFLLGAGSAVRLTEVTVGPLPSLPLLAGLPDGPIGATGAALLAVPVLAGMAAGWVLTRRLLRARPARSGEPVPPAREPAWSLVVGSALIAGPVAGIVLGILAWMSGGPLGNGRMAVVGPVPWQVGLVATGVVAVSASIGAALGRAFRAGPRRG
ncbi:MAG TPA: DUF6350 family protein [Actinoplanes sp.]|nr:DUF6350 family protein [Actinoplanes sp.]